MSSNTQILYIKNMVCPRCKLAVKNLLTRMGCTVLAVELGQTVVRSAPLPALSEISANLSLLGFDLLSTPKSKIVERVKTLLIYDIYYQRCQVTLPNLQNYLKLATHRDYQYLNAQFYSVYKISIKQYWDILRFERAKELLSYSEKAPEEIALLLDYHSKRELETIFYQTLNLSVIEFIRSEENYRLPIDKLI